MTADWMERARASFSTEAHEETAAGEPVLIHGLEDGAAPPLPPAAEVDDGELALIPLTDLGNAERFRRRFGGAFLFVSAIGWLRWDGRRWARHGADDAVKRAAHETVRAIQGEAAALRGTDADRVIEEKRGGRQVRLSDRVAGWGRTSEADSRLAAIPKLAAPYLTREAAELDADPWKLNVENGTLHISRRRGDGDPIVLRPHDPADLITKLAAVPYVPGALAPNYDRFLARVQPRDDMRRFLHSWIGYSLTGCAAEQKLTFHYGKGGNGKSTLFDAIGKIVGDYGDTIPIESFIDQGRGRNAGAATPDLAQLPGVRFLRTSEPEKGAKLAEALIKLATGGEPLKVRHLNRDYFSFKPGFKLSMSGNHRPVISGTDDGIWRRMVLVPWEVAVPKPERDLALPETLRGEYPGILCRLLDGLRDYLAHGLEIPPEAEEATARYREDSDPLGRFLRQCVADAPGARVQSSAMHSVFGAWARAAGERQWTAKGLSLAMKERGYRSLQSNVMWWLDVRLTASELDFDGDASPHPSQRADDD